MELYLQAHVRLHTALRIQAQGWFEFINIGAEFRGLEIFQNSRAIPKF
jgi:hypothetical protein